MSKFSEFVKDESNDKIKGDDKLNQDIDDLINKYSGLSNDELMSEFMKESARKKEKGELNESQLNSIKKILTPHLNDDQINKLNSLLDMIK